MEQVKILSSLSNDDLERETNKWLRDRDGKMQIERVLCSKYTLVIFYTVLVAMPSQGVYRTSAENESVPVQEKGDPTEGELNAFGDF